MKDRLDIGRKYMGLHETKDNAKLKKLLGINPADTAWCAAFVNAIEREAGSVGTGKLNARSFLKWGEPLEKPETGCVVVLKRGNSSWQGHVAYYVEDAGDSIILFGGNQDNRVCLRSYPKDNVLGYRKAK